MISLPLQMCWAMPASRLLSRMALFTAAMFWTLHSHAAVVSPEYFGLHIHRTDSGTSWPNVQFGSWRMWDSGVQWPDLQTTRGSWNFSRLDRQVRLAKSNHVAVLLPLGLSPRWASARPDEPSAYGEGKAAEPASMEDWRVYVRKVAQRYKGRIGAYEIWNEPNSKDFFSGTTTKLVELTCVAYQILKAVDPFIVVVGPAYTGGQNIAKLEGFLAAGGNKCIDVVAYHLYVPSSPPEAIPSLVKKIQLAMQRQGVSHLPLWNTEAGWFIENADGTATGKVPDYWLRVSAEQSAAFVARSLLLGSASGVERFFWYAWDNITLGLIEPKTKALKPGGVALGVVARWMTGGTRPACVEAEKLWTCTLASNPDERRVVAWSIGGAQRYTPPSGWSFKQCERADGRVEALDSSSSMRVDGLPRLFLMSPIKQGAS